MLVRPLLTRYGHFFISASLPGACKPRKRKHIVLPVERGFGLARLPSRRPATFFSTWKVTPLSASTGWNIYLATSLTMSTAIPFT